jgi:lysophospholipase L1-like esterase
MDDFMVKDGETFLFTGDSITDCGRRVENAPYGNGYVKAAIDLVMARYPERTIAFLNQGVSGNTVEDLFNRWHDDILVHRPSWISIKIGINDLHRHLADPSILSPKQFADIYRRILALTREKTHARLILVSPFFISTDTNPRSYRGQVLQLLPDYIAVVRTMAAEFGALFVPTQDLFVEQLRHRPADTFAPEPVHPSLSGHMVIAHGLLEVLNWQGSRDQRKGT